MDLTNKTILFADLDDTLIKTVSGRVFAEDEYDFYVCRNVLNAIHDKLPNLQYICIVTNQGGMGIYFTDTEFYNKLLYVRRAIEAILTRYYVRDIEVYYSVCTSLLTDNPKRKPNTGMLSECLHKYIGDDVSKDKMLMIGDASGKEGDYSDSDKQCAINFGIDYIDVRDFVNE